MIIDSVILEGIYSGCIFDLCTTENNKTLQNEYRCNAYEEIISVCNDLLGVSINWREDLGCRKNKFLKNFKFKIINF